MEAAQSQLEDASPSDPNEEDEICASWLVQHNTIDVECIISIQQAVYQQAHAHAHAS